MLTRRGALRTALSGLALFLAALPAQANERMNVTASFSILADMTRQVGGERIKVETLVGAGEDAHVFQPTPTDAKKVASAKVLVVNGLGFEGWMTRLVRSAGFKGRTVVAAEGVKTLAADEHGHDEHGHGEDHGHSHDHGSADPHAWQSLANAKIYVANIRDGLIAADPDGRTVYEENARRYLAEISALETEMKAAAARIPQERRKVITAHGAFRYFEAAYGLTFIAPSGVTTESEAAAGDVAAIISRIKAEKIPALFLENVVDRRLLDQIAKETGAKIGGALYSDALSDADGPAPTYLQMMRHNMNMLSAALAPA